MLGVLGMSRRSSPLSPPLIAPSWLHSSSPDSPLMAAGMRRELLVATRHILQTDFRVGFFTKIDHLLDESVLIGSVTCPTQPCALDCHARLSH